MGGRADGLRSPPHARAHPARMGLLDYVGPAADRGVSYPEPDRRAGHPHLQWRRYRLHQVLRPIRGVVDLRRQRQCADSLHAAGLQPDQGRAVRARAAATEAKRSKFRPQLPWQGREREHDHYQFLLRAVRVPGELFLHVRWGKFFRPGFVGLRRHHNRRPRQPGRAPDHALVHQHHVSERPPGWWRRCWPLCSLVAGSPDERGHAVLRVPRQFCRPGRGGGRHRVR